MCTGGSLVSARFVTPAGGAFGAGGVVDAVGAVAPHVVIEPEGATAPAGETDGRDVPGCGTGEPAGGVGPAAGQPDVGSVTDPTVKPAASTLKTTKTTASKTTVTKTTKHESATATAPTLPKTGDNNWIAASVALFLLGTVLLAATYCCWGVRHT